MKRDFLPYALFAYILLLSDWSFGSTNSALESSLKMFKSLAKGAEVDNFVFSPFAIRTGLGMTALGAKGKTQRQLGKAPDLGPLKKEPPTPLILANRLWVQYGFPLYESYKETSEKNFGEHPWMVDFTKAPDFLKDRVNGWVEEKTQGKLKGFISEDSVDPTSKMLLTIGVYFKSQWMSPFSKGFTRSDEFRSGHGEALNVSYLHKVASYPYFKNEKWQVLELPYSDADLSVLIVLPRSRQGFSQMEQSLEPETLEQWIDGLHLKDVDIDLPKFEFQSSFEISETLKSIGVVDAFSPTEADFSGMTAVKGLYLGRTIHKTGFGLTEEGTEAAAISAESAARNPASSLSPETFHVNRPFLFMVRHKPSRSLLFMGHVFKPLSL